MGGLVARAALNLYSTLNKSTFPVEFISLCTPYGGSNEASQSIKSAPVVVDSWQDIATGSAFLQKLNDTKLSKNIRFTLIFGYRNSGIPNIDGCSDGTILLSKQLFLPVQQTADVVLGFEETHTGILTNKDVAGQIGVILNHFHHDE